MLHNKSHSQGTRRVSPPQPTCMSSDQKASYLADLRNNRPARPNRPVGSRPLPPKPTTSQDENLPPRAGSALSLRDPEPEHSEHPHKVRERKLSHRMSMPTTSSYGSLGSQKGRPLVSSINSTMAPTHRRFSPISVAGSEVSYKESAARLREKNEAHTLREALEKIDQKDDDRRLHDAAKMEAADLVWQHQNPRLAEFEKTAAYRNPDLNGHAEKSKYGELGNAKKTPQPASRSASAESSSSTESRRPRLPWLRKRPKPENLPSVTATETQQENVLQKGARKISGKRQTSSGSTKGIFRNPEDEIYDETEEMPDRVEMVPKDSLPVRARESNALPQGSRPPPNKSSDKALPTPHLKTAEMDSPTAIGNVGHTAQRTLPVTPIAEEDSDDSDEPSYKDGIEVRSNDIRAATSMRKSDRSPNLPTPTAVSDRIGRPIVSFDPKWRRDSESPKKGQDASKLQSRRDDGSIAYPPKPTPAIPEIIIMEEPVQQSSERAQESTTQWRQAAPPSAMVPVIDVSDVDMPQEKTSSRSLPQINVSNTHSASTSIPSISVNENLPASQVTPSITVGSGARRPLPAPTQSKSSSGRPAKSEIASRVPWLSRAPTSASTNTVTCTACTLPISGRIVTASGAVRDSQKARFHPECFTCYHCSTALECVSFYPEPENARLERFQAALIDLQPEDPRIRNLVDSNEDLHFFCHLDYHELFSPRCHNCKTPIEGAIVLALGRHYHQDHFFCAECGDPFSAESPFVEHNSYPYCVSCHTKRTSARCRACKLPILNEMTIEALDGKWHDACFVCCDCGGDFGEEGRFFVRQHEVELTDKERRKGFGTKFEEKAACQACEERRVKNVNVFM